MEAFNQSKSVCLIDVVSLRIPLLKVNTEKLIQKNTLNQKKGSFNKEVSLERKRANIEEKMTFLKQQRKKFIEKREKIRKDIEEVKLEIHFLENLENLVNMNEVYLRKKDEYMVDVFKRKQSKKKMSSRRSSVDSDLIKYTLSLQVAYIIYSREQQMKEKVNVRRRRLSLIIRKSNATI